MQAPLPAVWTTRDATRVCYFFLYTIHICTFFFAVSIKTRFTRTDTQTFTDTCGACDMKYLCILTILFFTIEHPIRLYRPARLVHVPCCSLFFKLFYHYTPTRALPQTSLSFFYTLSHTRPRTRTQTKNYQTYLAVFARQLTLVVFISTRDCAFEQTKQQQTETIVFTHKGMKFNSCALLL